CGNSQTPLRTLSERNVVAAAIGAAADGGTHGVYNVVLHDAIGVAAIHAAAAAAAGTTEIVAADGCVAGERRNDANLLGAAHHAADPVAGDAAAIVLHLDAAGGVAPGRRDARDGVVEYV